MSWINWIPIAGTIENAASDPKGTKVSDYNCTMDRSVCGEAGAEQAAILECQRDIDAQLRQFITDYQGGAIADQYIGTAASGVGSALISALIRLMIAQRAGAAAIGVTGVGAVVLGIDGMINLSITLEKLAAMRAAAEQAKTTCCSCDVVRCSESEGDRPIARGEKINGSYYGGIRSFKLTKKEMQRKAEDDYMHICVGDEGCDFDECKPVAYVTDWEQSTRIFWMRTDLTYDVYCECK